MKPGKDAKKQDDKDDKDEKPGRGRGRGRGQGRGRGRGNAKEEKEKDQEKAKPSKSRKKKDQEDDWAAWGTEDAWKQGWGDDNWNQEQWAWDSQAYWEAQCSMYELEELCHDSTAASSQAAPDNQGTSKAKSKSEKKETGTGSKEVKGAAKETAVKADTVEKPTKTKKSKQKEDANKEDDPVETEPKKKKPKSSGSKENQPPKQPSGTTENTEKKKKKKKKQDTDQGESRKKAKTNVPTPPPPDLDDVAPADAASKEKCLRKILEFMNGFRDLEEKSALSLMRGRLQSVYACRMNVYWNRGAVGLHHRKQKMDFAYFRPIPEPDSECSQAFVMAAALKAAEIVVTRLYQTKQGYNFNSPLLLYTSILTVWFTVLCPFKLRYIELRL